MTAPDPWRCRVCGAAYPVPSLARCCEHEHHRLRDQHIREEHPDQEQPT